MAALEGKIEKCGTYLNALLNSTPSAVHINRHSEIVQDRAIKRSLVSFGHRIASDALESATSALSLLDKASSELGKLSIGRSDNGPVQVGEDIAAYCQELDRRMNGDGRRLATGFPSLDEKLNGGIAPGEVIVVAARPKMGKTGFALNIASNVAMQSNVLVLSLEMQRGDLHDRNIANLGRIPLPHLLQPSLLTEQEKSRLHETMQKMQSMQLFIDDQGGLRLFDIKMKARRMKRKAGLDLLIIDYLQLMDGDGETRNAQIEGITRGLKSLAKELEIGIILLSQLNRDLEKRPDRRPQPSDLRDSGAIEQDADAVLFLYRDEVYDPDTVDRGICEVNVALCRQGAPGRIALRFVGEQIRFESLSEPWKPGGRQARRKELAAQL